MFESVAESNEYDRLQIPVWPEASRGRSCGYDRDLGFWLGSIHDKELAELSGNSIHTIRHWRKVLRVHLAKGLRSENYREAHLYRERVARDLLRLQSLTKTGRVYQITRERVRQIGERLGIQRAFVFGDPKAAAAHSVPLSSLPDLYSDPE